jgi:dihydroneopterin aldolase
MTHAVNSITVLHAGFSSSISLNDLRLMVNLGVTAHERDVKQEINVSFKFFFKKQPGACETDDIDDTVCYHKISDAVKGYCEFGQFKLLEYMCNGLYNKIRADIARDIKIWIRIEKCNPPIYGLLGSTSFESTDIWE